MGRVSLTEAYDDRSVISKLNEMDKRVTENTVVVTSAEASAKASAQAAQETADRFAGSVGAVVQNANAQINASKAQVDQAKAEVDATVTTVAQAVQTANQASASAQQSATTVEGYDARLTAVEDADTNNVKLHPNGDQHISGTLYIDAWNTYGPQQFKLRGTQTDGWKVIGISDSKGDVTKIQMNRDEIQLVGDKIFRNTVLSGADSRSIVNKGYVESTDGETNNLVHRTANETIDGTKTFDNNAIGIMDIPMNFVATTSVEDVGWRRIAEIDYVGSSNICMEVELIGSGNNRYAKAFLNAYITTSACVSYIYGFGNNAASVNTRIVNDIALVRKVEGTTSHVYLMVRNERYENWLAKLTYFGGIQGRYNNVATRARKVVSPVEPEPTTDTYEWVSKPTKMTVI